MSLHIGAKVGEIAERVLLPGDPLRAEYIAEKFLTNITQYNEVRNMFGFTGTYNKNNKVTMLFSTQGSGMGMPSLSIYVNELYRDYGVQEIIRVGTCGAFQNYVNLQDIILAMSSCSNSNINRRRFQGLDYAPTANWDLLLKAYELAKSKALTSGLRGYIGTILSSDTFYDPNPDEWKMWAGYGVLGVEMETAELYTLAAKYKRKALSILTVSDCVYDLSKTLSSEERQSSLDNMIEIALQI